ncbi:hypothetical protein ACGFQG_27070 [Nocardia fluminea]|uniref:hypothetical protein n=1 Tax=Nocardia fluminea TaxID=134984 RepID=UPI0037110FD8
MDSALHYSAVVFGTVAGVVALSFGTSTIVHYRVAKETARWRAAQESTDDSHHAPLVRFTVAQAHRQMRDHLLCRRESCERKAQAFQVLVEAGRIVPASDIGEPTSASS